MLLKNKLPFWIALNSYAEAIVSGVPPLSLSKAKNKPVKELKAFGGTEQRDIPDNYLQRQFIYMMDSSYLLTDIVPTPDCKIEFDFQTLTIASGARTYLGCRDTSGSNDGLRVAHISNGNFRIYGFGTYADSATAARANTRYKFIWNNKQATITTGGTTIFDNTFAAEGTNQTAVAINGWNTAGTVDANSEGMYLYSLKIWNGNGELIADYVPAVQKGTVPVVGFYDTVSETFMTATSGTFAAGAEAVPTPDYPMDIICNNGVLKARHQSGLPLGYTLLDSVVFDSTQVIDTGFTPDNDSRIESKCYRTGDDCWLYGASPTNPRITLYHSRTGTSRWGNQSRNNFNFSANTEYTLIQDKNGLTINGTLYPWNSGTAGDFTCDSSLTIGDCNGATGSTPKFSGNFYYMKIYDNNVLVRDFVPCQNASNVVGLYDRANDVFYTDTGLVAGTAVSDPVEIYTDGTVETINIHTKNLFDVNNVEIQESTAISANGSLITHVSVDTCITYIPVKPNTTYTISGDILGTSSVFFRLAQYKADKTFISRSDDSTGERSSYTFTTGVDTYYIRFHYIKSANLNTYQLEQGSTATAYVPYFDGGTATCEDLLSVGTYTDEQEVISGAITRKVGVKVLTGAENWLYNTNYARFNIGNFLTNSLATNSFLITHGVSGTQNHNWRILANNTLAFYDDLTWYADATAFKTFLAAQYAAGTPVIVVYPLATETAETVTGQPMSTTEGDNIAEITQASMSGLELSVKYIKGA